MLYELDHPEKPFGSKIQFFLVERESKKFSTKGGWSTTTHILFFLKKIGEKREEEETRKKITVVILPTVRSLGGILTAGLLNNNKLITMGTNMSVISSRIWRFNISDLCFKWCVVSSQNKHFSICFLASGLFTCYPVHIFTGSKLFRTCFHSPEEKMMEFL